MTPTNKVNEMEKHLGLDRKSMNLHRLDEIGKMIISIGSDYRENDEVFNMVNDLWKLNSNIMKKVTELEE